MNIEEMIQKIKEAKGLCSDRELAEVLEISPQNFSNRRKRGSLRPLLLEKLIELELYQGDGAGLKGSVPTQGLDAGVLREVIEKIEKVLETGDRSLSPEKKADLIVTVYTLKGSGQEVTSDLLARLINLAS